MNLRARSFAAAEQHACQHPPRWVAVLAGLCVLGAASFARADETSGTWTGELEGRPNYYWERSTRVVPPDAKIALEAPNGVRVRVNYLVDVISSASIASGTGSDAVFTEIRHQFSAGAGKAFTMGENEIDLSATATYSTEPDYKSWLYGVRGIYSFNEKNSAVRLALKRVDDTVLSNADPTFDRSLTGLTTTVGLMQLLSPVMTLDLGYQFVFLQGYMGNPYRRALVGPLPRQEQPPEKRLRHNVEAQLAWFFPQTETTLRGYFRVYGDSWDIAAITPELRIYQRFASDWVARLRYRYYDQSKANFALPPGETRYPVPHDGPVTNDPKMSAFHSHQVGLRLELTLSGLAGTFLSFAERGVLDVSFDYQWCNSTFGNNVIGTAGGRLPF